MGRFFQELKRRKVDRVVVAYLAVAWLLIQVAETLLPAYGFTDMAIRNLVAVLGVGLIVTVMLSWSFEWTPEGIIKDSAARPSKTARSHGTKGLDRFIIAALTVAVAFFAIDKFVIDPARDARNIEAAAERARADALSSEKSDKSVAVLPFANRSNRDDDVYFVDGIHDDILTQLARIDALAVTSRTSVEQYRGTTQTIKDIGAALDVTAILEGGVQRAGDRVRINVQLINTANDDHLWAETYERELTAANIFSVQADIATKVADALRAALLPDEQLALDEAPTESYRAYDLYLLGRYHWNKRTKESVDLAQQYFEQAIEADPDFVLALSGLADSYVFQVQYGTQPGDVAYPLAKDVIDQAMALDEESSEVWASLGLLRRNQNQFGESETAFRRAIDLDPKNSSAWFWYSQMLWLQRRYADALSARQTAYALEPMSWIINDRLASIYRQMGDFDEARQHYERADQVRESQSTNNIPSIIYSYFWSGEFAHSVREARSALSAAPDNLNVLYFVTESYLALGNIGEAEAWFERAASVSDQFRQGYLIPVAQEDYDSAIAYLEDTLELQKPRRNLRVLYELFRAHYLTGDLRGARKYLEEYLDTQQGRLEIRPHDAHQLEELMVAAFLVNHGDVSASEPARGRELAEEIHQKMTALRDGGWLHPLMFASLSAAEALLGNTDAAIANLDEAIDSGYRSQQAGLMNPAFDSLRDTPEFVLAAERIQALIDEENVRLASMTLAPYTPPVQYETIVVARETLEIYEGWYSDGNALSHVYIANDGQFMGTLGQNSAEPMLAIAEDEFYAPVDKSFTVQFVTDENGVATHFLVKGAFGEILFKAVDDPPPAIQLPREVLARYEGTYSHDRLGSLESERAESDIWSADIYVDDAGKIWIDYDNQPKLELNAISETEFDLIGFEGRFLFDIDPVSGDVDHFIMLADGREFQFYRD